MEVLVYEVEPEQALGWRYPPQQRQKAISEDKKQASALMCG